MDFRKLENTVALAVSVLVLGMAIFWLHGHLRSGFRAGVLVSFKKWPLLQISSTANSVRFQAPSGKNFLFVVGIPESVDTNTFSFGGQVLVTREGLLVYECTFDQISVTRSTWLGDRKLIGLIINFRSDGLVPLIPGIEYEVRLVSTNLIGGSLWLHFASDAGVSRGAGAVDGLPGDHGH